MINGNYEVYVFDVDGTLYFQRKVRMIMAKRLLVYYAFHPLRIKDLFIIKEFRALREKAQSVDMLYKDTGAKYKVSPEYVSDVIDKWIYKNPIDAVSCSKDEKLLCVIKKLKEAGKKIVIWSDYFADDKLEALGVEADAVYTADDSERQIDLKPSDKALRLIMNDFNVSPDKVLMVGDRMEKDGLAAKSAGTDYIILKKTAKEREGVYENA